MDTDAILNEILAALKGELGGGFSKIKKFATRQGEMMARQAALIARGRLDGDFVEGDPFYQFLLKNLKDLAANTARAIAMQTLLTIEKAWNAIANVVWGALRGVLTAAGLPAPLIPAKPPKLV